MNPSRPKLIFLYIGCLDGVDGWEAKCIQSFGYSCPLSLQKRAGNLLNVTAEFHILLCILLECRDT